MSAYEGESVSSALLDSFASSIPNGYHVYRHTDGRDYLTPNDPTAPSAFEYKEGWYVSNNLAIGQDNAKGLAVTSTAKSSDYRDDGSVAKIVDPNPNLKVFGSDTPNKITVDNTKITSVHSGVGEDNIDTKNGAELVEISGGSGNDGITVNNSTVSGKAAKDYKGNDIKEAIVGGKGDDKISVQNESNVKGNISGDQGGNTITVESGSKVAGWVYGANAKTADMYNETGNNTITVTGENTEVSRVGDVSSGDSKITISDKAKVKSVHGDKGADTITVDNATVSEKIEGGHGDDKIYVRNGARVEGYVTGDLDNDTIEVSGENTYVKEVKGGKGDDTITVEDKAKVFTIEGNDGTDTINVKNNATVGNVFGNDGIDTINVENATVKGNIRGGAGDDVITAKGSSSIDNILGEAGKDTITLESGAKVIGQIRGDTKTMNDVHEKQVTPTLDIVDKGADADTITLSGAGTSAEKILGGDGNDIIKVKDGAKTDLIISDEGNDEVTVSGTGTYVGGINGRGGDDTILVEKGAKVDGIVGRWGNDKITVKDAGTVVTENVEGNEDADTIKILDGARVKGYVSGGLGENPSIYGGASDSDKDNVTVENSTVEGVVEGGIWGGNDGMKIKNSHIGGISGGNGENKIDISNVTNLDSKTIWGNKFKDIVNIDGTLINSEIKTIEGEDIVNINAGAIIDKIDINTGADKDTVNINANITADVGKQSNIMTEGGIDKVNIASGVTLTRTVISTGAGEETIKINNGKTGIADRITFEGSSLDTGADKDIVEITNTMFKKGSNGELSNLNTGDGDDRITIKDGTIFQDISYIQAGDGNDKVYLESGAKFDTGNVYTDAGNDEIYVNGAEFKNGGVHSGTGEDKIFINSGTFENSSIKGNQDSDKITVNGNTKIKGGNIDTGAGANDKININGNAEIDGTTLQLGASSVDGGKSTDRATLNVTGNSVLKDVTIQASQSLGEQYMNFHQSGEAKIQTITGSNNKDVIDITGNFTVSDKITGNGGDDEINIHGGATAKIQQADMGNGSDKLNIKNGATLNGTRIFTGDGVDNITIQGTVKGYSNIFTGDGNDIVKVKQGGIIKDSFIQTQGGKDQIDIENGGKLENSKITVGEGAVVTVQGTLDKSTIDAGNSTGSLEVKILNGANINVESYSYGVSKIIGGENNDKVTMEGGTIAKGDIKLGKGDDIVKITGGEIKDNSAIEGGEGKDTITIGGNAKMIGGTLNTGAGLGDKILVKDGGGLQDTEIKLGANGQNGGQSTDKALFEVTGSSELKDVQINAAESSGEQRINFYNDTVAEVKSLTGSNQKDIIDIKGKVKFNSEIQTRDGDDELILRNGAVLENGLKADMGSGVDTVKITGATIQSDASGNNQTIINTGDGGDKVIIENSKILSPDQLHMNEINTGDGVDKVDIKGNSVLEFAKIDTGDGGDKVNIGGEFFASYAHTKEGDDIINVNGQIKGWSEIDAGEGGDEITINSGAKLYDGTSIYGNKGDDTITLKSGIEFIADRNGSLLDGGEGNDTFVIEKVADINKDYLDEAGNISGRVQINGDSGTDTLKIMDDSASLDFSKTNILSIERIEMGDATKNVTLSAKNILDITKGESSTNHILDILGDGNDKVDLKGSGFTKLGNYTDDDGKVWRQYSATNTDNTLNGISHTVTIRIEDGVTVDI
ncbi:beta strand repeat-containing protein [Campylobacter concisus]|uniref:beta strand repeat-containing protein n=1 Tax=Campylobacter concisus TaxID=199 RepID=UPI000D339709|nr:hypothetical protein [Campylobacter concisus]QPH87213.1 hypothetical protein CVT15_00405 [Campylobacter concisus]